MLGQHKLPAVAGLHERTVSDAEYHASTYTTPARSRSTRPRVARVDTQRIDQAVLDAALKLASGDARRLRLNKDGSVYVC